MEVPLISVIVPVYKVEKYLDRCIKSIVSQTYKNLEIILVDDGSPDNCPQICDEWSKKDNRIKVIHIKNQGVSAARNMGIDYANGDYIGFVDSDDWLANDMYELLMKNVLKTGADISHCSFYKAESEYSFIEGLGTGVKLVCGNEKGIEECLKLNSFILSIWNKLYSKEVLKNVRFENGRYISEDTLFNFLAFQNAKKTIYDGKPKYYYFTRLNSAIESPFSSKNLDVIYFTDFILQLTRDYYPNLIHYAERRDIVENILMVNSIISSQSFPVFEKEYREIIRKLKGYLKIAIKNTKLHYKYKLLLLVLYFNERLFVTLLTNFLSKRQEKND